MRMTDQNYVSRAREAAADCVRNFIDEIVEQILDDNLYSASLGEASDNLLDDRKYSGGDSYHHETHVDKSYRLLDAAELLDQLDDHEETDNGLWEGQSPREAISIQAAYTFGNAVMHYWQELIEEINTEAGQISSEYDDEFYDLEKLIDEAEEDSEDEAVADAKTQLEESKASREREIREKIEELCKGYDP